LIQPSYIERFNSGALEKSAEVLCRKLLKCTLCPHQCSVNRTENQVGKCKTGILPVVSSYSPHFGEEKPLVGTKGSGTIFFSRCNLSCIFCQNYEISQQGRGEEISFEGLAEIMLHLQQKGCHNINFVSPTHVNYAILRALLIAVPKGLQVPLIYNSGGYDAVDTIKQLDGIFDIYMPDLKYMDTEIALRLSGSPDYPERATAAIAEMHRQVGDLVINQKGIATRGLLIRHLVLPNNMAATDKVINFIANLSRDTYINIMDQYRPEYRAREYFDLKRRITLEEYDAAVNHAIQSSLTRIDGVRAK
jgi:putative pyruvate formate lyase activating enzyme